MREEWRAGATESHKPGNTPILPCRHTPLCSASRLDFDHVVRRGLAHAGGADADVTGLLAELGQICRAEVAHAGLDSADQLSQDQIERRGYLLECFDAFRRELLRVVGQVTVTRRR